MNNNFYNNEDAQFGLLDLLNLASFVIQIQNQKNIIKIKDVQHEVDRAIDEIHLHLEKQDKKIDEILKYCQKIQNGVSEDDR